MKNYVFIGLVLSLSACSCAQNTHDESIHDAEISPRSFHAVERRLLPADALKLRAMAESWEQNPSERALIAYSDAVFAAAMRQDIKSAVVISSSRGKNATVKYQTIGQRSRNEPATTANGLTDLVENLTMGVYHIWSERRGRPTSDRDAQFMIDQYEEHIVLDESSYSRRLP